MENNLPLFKKIYLEKKSQPTAAALFITHIADVCKKSEMTVRMWLCGRQVPDELTKSIIAKDLGVEPDELFNHEA